MSTTTHTGLYVSFDPQTDLLGELRHFKVYLHSRLPENITVGYAWLLKEEVRFEVAVEAPAHSDHFLHTVWLDELNDAPAIAIEVTLATPVPGKQHRFERDQRIKPKGFFSRLQETPFFGHPVYLFEVVNSLPDEHQVNPKPLQSHFSRIRQSQHSRRSAVEAKAHLTHEIDLHIDKLVKAPGKLDPTEILSVQMREFERYLNNAITFGLHRVFIIHGVGKGTLRQAIWQRLNEYPQVRSYRNEYHSQYGFGATEVELG